MFESSGRQLKIKNALTPGEPAASEASDLSSLYALAEATASELEVNFELWRMTGFDIAQRPPSALWRNALWARCHLDAIEGRPLALPADHAMWFYLDPRPESGCGVEAFA